MYKGKWTPMSSRRVSIKAPMLQGALFEAIATLDGWKGSWNFWKPPLVAGKWPGVSEEESRVRSGTPSLLTSLSCHVRQPTPPVRHIVLEDAKEDALDCLRDRATLAVAYRQPVD